MKTTIKLFAFLLAAGYPCVAFAEFLGARVPSTLNVENVVGLFALAVTALILISDYSRRGVRTISLPATAPAMGRRTHECHRLAA